MKVPYYWLLEYVDIDKSAEEVASLLTSSGIEVDTVEGWAPSLDGVVAAKILSIGPHPNADRLQLAEIDAGDDDSRIIVCGAKNMSSGDMVPLALPGAILPGGKIKAASIRGVKSDGMLCSASELGLDIVQAEDGLLILQGEIAPGTPLAEAYHLDELVLDLDLTPNRSDCQGMLGVAREVAAITGGRLKLPVPQVKEEGLSAADTLQVNILDPALCLRYAGRIVSGANVAPSPHIIQLRLLAAGIRPINNVVDITNYVMWEYGQPMHAFDREKLSGTSITVRGTTAEEMITTLDGIDRNLDEGMLVIADEKKPVAIAGIMGGEATEISAETKNLLLESALFSQVSVRRTSRALGLRSEASVRFERGGVDPEGTLEALNRCAEMIHRMSGGRVLRGIVDNYPNPVKREEIFFRPEYADKLLGIEISRERMLELLTRLGMKIKAVDGGYMVNVPSLRVDIVQEVDLIEEIGRLYGYNNIPSTLPVGELTAGELTRRQKLDLLARRHLSGIGLSEIVAFSFYGQGDLTRMNYTSDSPRLQAIPILKPMSEDQSLLRLELLPGMLKTAAYNYNHQVQNQRFFELGKVYLPADLPLTELPREEWHLSMLLMGNARDDWTGSEAVDFFYLKGLLESLASVMRLPPLTFIAEAGPQYHPTRSAQVQLGENIAGGFGQVHPEVAANWGIDMPVYAAEFNFDILVSDASYLPEYKPVPRYPAALRDIAVIVRENIPAAKLESVIFRAGGSLVESVKLFDLYCGKQIPDNHKSMAYAVTFRREEGTLTDLETEDVMVKIRRALEEEFSALFRS